MITFQLLRINNKYNAYHKKTKYMILAYRLQSKKIGLVKKEEK